MFTELKFDLVSIHVFDVRSGFVFYFDYINEHNTTHTPCNTTITSHIRSMKRGVMF